MSERVEAVLRIPFGIVYGLISGVWGMVAEILVAVHWIYVIITGRRHYGMASFSNKWISYAYRVGRYMLFATNERPWPIGPGSIEEIDAVDAPEYV